MNKRNRCAVVQKSVLPCVRDAFFISVTCQFGGLYFYNPVILRYHKGGSVVACPFNKPHLCEVYAFVNLTLHFGNLFLTHQWRLLL